MAFSPNRLLTHLLASFPDEPGDPTLTRAEEKLSSHIYNILVDASLDALDIDEEEVLEYDADSTDEEWSPEEECGVMDDCMEKISFGDSTATLEQVRQAISHYRNTKKGSRPFSSMHQRFRFISQPHHITKVLQLEKAGIRPSLRVRMRHLAALLKEEVRERVRKGLVIHDITLRQLALRINADHGLADGFKASHGWINSFKKFANLRSRRVTKFVSRKVFEDKDKLVQIATDFVSHTHISQRTRP